MADNTWTRSETYDARTGRFIRNVRVNDIFHISTSGIATGATAGGSLASGTTTSNEEVFVTGIVATTNTAGQGVYVTNGTSTVMAFFLGQNAPYTVVGSRDSPLFRVPASTTVTLRSDSAGTYSASLWGVREPTSAILEPDPS